MTIEIRPTALEQANEARQYYDAQQYDLGTAFLAELDATAAVIRKAPFAQVLYHNVRARQMKRFPYRLFYVVDDVRQHITVVAVVHTARSPSRWPE